MRSNWQDFFKNTFTIALGSGFAQLVTVLVSPILTRLFSPEDFGLLALYGAMVSVLTTVATLRYEQTIVLPDSDKKSMALVVLSLLITTGLSVCVFLLICIFEEKVVSTFRVTNIVDILYWVPLALFGNGVYQTCSYFSIRKKQFKQISGAQITQSLVAASGQVGMGLISIKGGLILGQLLGLFGACIILGRTLHRMICAFSSKVTGKDLFGVAIEYRSYPTFSLIGALSNSLSAQLPIFFIVRYFADSVVGIYAFSYRIVTLPISILGQGVSQVFLQRISTLQHTHPERIYGEVCKMSAVLFVLMLPVAIAVWVWGESLFAMVFGELWREAGGVAGMLIIAVIFRFPVSALSGVLVLKETLKFGVAWQMVYLLTLLITLMCLQSFSFHAFLIVFVSHEVLQSLVYLWFILKGARKLGHVK